MNNKLIPILLISIIVVFAFSSAASIFTARETSGEWYNSIKPSITPPSFIFPIVWTVLYLLLALSFSLAFVNSKKSYKKKVVYLFLSNIIINSLWTLFYFGFRNPLLALIDILLLESIIIYTLVFFWNKYRLISYLNIPYALWVGFATLLNILTIIK